MVFPVLLGIAAIGGGCAAAATGTTIGMLAGSFLVSTGVHFIKDGKTPIGVTYYGEFGGPTKQQKEADRLRRIRSKENQERLQAEAEARRRVRSQENQGRLQAESEARRRVRLAVLEEQEAQAQYHEGMQAAFAGDFAGAVESTSGRGFLHNIACSDFENPNHFALCPMKESAQIADQFKADLGIALSNPLQTSGHFQDSLRWLNWNELGSSDDVDRYLRNRRISPLPHLHLEHGQTRDDQIVTQFRADIGRAIAGPSAGPSRLQNVLEWNGLDVLDASADVTRRIQMKNTLHRATLFKLDLPPEAGGKTVIRITNKKNGSWDVRAYEKNKWKPDPASLLPKTKKLKQIQKFVKVAQKCGKGIHILSIGADATRLIMADDKLKMGAVIGGEWGGSFAGGAGMAWSCAAIGSLIAPGIGTVIGGAVSMVVGSAAGAEFVGSWVEDIYDTLTEKKNEEDDVDEQDVEIIFVGREEEFKE